MSVNATTVWVNGRFWDVPRLSKKVADVQFAAHDPCDEGGPAWWASVVRQPETRLAELPDMDPEVLEAIEGLLPPGRHVKSAWTRRHDGQVLGPMVGDVAGRSPPRPPALHTR